MNIQRYLKQRLKGTYEIEISLRKLGRTPDCHFSNPGAVFKSKVRVEHVEIVIAHDAWASQSLQPS